jgi:hypothetical protein
MSRWADWFTISPEQATAFIEAKKKKGSAEAVEKLLRPWLAKFEKLNPHVEMDKAWEPIHRCLTGDWSGGLLFTCGPSPLKYCVLGGRQILRGQRTASLVEPDKVTRVAKALAKIDRDWLHERFFELPNTQFHEIDEDSFGWVWDEFEKLPPFFTKAGAKGRAVICTISH